MWELKRLFHSTAGLEAYTIISIRSSVFWDFIEDNEQKAVKLGYLENASPKKASSLYQCHTKAFKKELTRRLLVT